MKMRMQHIVPLSTQAISVLRDLQPLTGRFAFAFPGFRGMASTLLNEQGWNGDAIERQLAHGERDAVRAAYPPNDAGVGGLPGCATALSSSAAAPPFISGKKPTRV